MDDHHHPPSPSPPHRSCRRGEIAAVTTVDHNNDADGDCDEDVAGDDETVCSSQEGNLDLDCEEHDEYDAEEDDDDDPDEEDGDDDDECDCDCEECRRNSAANSNANDNAEDQDPDPDDWLWQQAHEAMAMAPGRLRPPTPTRQGGLEQLALRGPEPERHERFGPLVLEIDRIERQNYDRRSLARRLDWRRDLDLDPDPDHSEQRGDPVNEQDLCAICYQSAGTKCPMLELPCCHKATSTSHFCTSCIVKCFSRNRGTRTDGTAASSSPSLLLGECPLCKTLLALYQESAHNQVMRFPTLEQKFWYLFHTKPGSRSMFLTIAYTRHSAWLPDELLYGDCVHGQEMARQLHQWGFLHRQRRRRIGWGGLSLSLSSSSSSSANDSYSYSFPPEHQYELQQLIESSNLCIDEEGDLVVKVPPTTTPATGSNDNRRYDFSFCISGQTVMAGMWTAIKRRKIITALRLANDAAILLCVSVRIYPWYWIDPKVYPSSSSSSSSLRSYLSPRRLHMAHHQVKTTAYTLCNLYLFYKLVGLVWRLVLVAWNVVAAWGAITVVATLVHPNNRPYRIKSRRWQILVLCSLVYYGYHYGPVFQPDGHGSMRSIGRSCFNAASASVKSGVQSLASGGGGGDGGCDDVGCGRGGDDESAAQFDDDAL